MKYITDDDIELSHKMDESATWSREESSENDYADLFDIPEIDIPATGDTEEIK